MQKAVELEDELYYDEPPTWFYPVRHNLGAVLLEAGRYQEAQKVYEEDLLEFPEKGWALFGLHSALLKQDKTNEAEQVEIRFKDAWKYADIELTASRIL